MMWRLTTCAVVVGALASSGVAACGTVRPSATSPSPARAAASISRSALDGTWIVTDVTTSSGRRIRVAAQRRADVLQRRPYVKFGEDDTIHGFDAVDEFGGRFRLVGNQVRTAKMSSTLAGLTDSAPRSLVEIVAAFSPLVVGRPVTVDVREGRMKLRAGSYTLAAVKG